MNNSVLKTTVLVLLSFCSGWNTTLAHSQSSRPPLTLPQNAKELCPVDSKLFDSWLVSANKPEFKVPNNADFSITDKKSINCNFYRQMTHNFLWMSSPQKEYPFVFFGSQFQNVVGFDSLFNPIFQPNEPAIGHVKRGILSLRGGKPSNRIGVGSHPGINAVGEAGANSDQNGGAIIFSQAKKGTAHLVYYGAHVNNVYVALQRNQNQVPYFTTKTNPGFQNFPVSKEQVREIGQVSNGVVFPDENALIIEAKSAWLDADAVDDPAQFLTIVADVPVFGKCAPQSPPTCVSSWDGKTYAVRKLVMVGLHVVAALKGHPELVWATFEHNANAPFSTYSYITKHDQLATRKFSSNVAGTFFEKGTPISMSNLQSYLVRKPSSSPPSSPIQDIRFFSGGLGTPSESSPPFIVPTNIVLSQPFGGSYAATDGIKQETPINNTQLISLANSLQTRLKKPPFNHALKNYVQTGAVWTQGGIIPSLNPTIPRAVNQPRLEGSTSLANSTMETYFQWRNGGNYATGCFGCHNTQQAIPNQKTQGVNVSHLFNLSPAPAATGVGLPSGQSEVGKK